MPEPGRLFYLMGASGAGKDSLIRYAREHHSRPKSIKFAQRFITRPADPENSGSHHAIKPAQFDRLLKNNYFAMHWRRHDFQYGISKKIDLWLKEGKDVIINGSRKYYAKARMNYPGIHAILVQADHELLRKRLLTRQRDSPEDIEKRMLWTDNKIIFEDQNELFSIINNDASLKIAGEKFMAILQA